MKRDRNGRRAAALVLSLVGTLCCGSLVADDNGFRQEGQVQLVLDPLGFRSRIRDLEFSADGKLLAAAGETEVRLYDLEAGQLLHTLRGDRLDAAGYGNVNAVTFSPDGRELLVGIDDFTDVGAIRVYSTGRWDEIQEVVGGMNVPARRLAFSRDGRWLAAVGENGNLYIYDWPQRKIVKTIPPPQPDQPILDALTFPSRSNVVFALGLSGPKFYRVPDGAELQPAHLPRDMFQWLNNVAGGRVQYPLNARDFLPQIFDLALERDVWLVGGNSKSPTGSPEYWVGAYAAGGTRPTAVYNTHPWTVSAVAASPRGELAASADLFGQVHVWNIRTGRQEHRFQSLTQELYEASFDRTSSRVAFGTTHYSGKDYTRNHFGPATQVFDLAARTLGDADFAQGLEPQTEKAQLGGYRVELKRAGDDLHLVAYDGAREKSRYRVMAGTSPMCYTLPEKHGFDIPHPVIFGDDRGLVACWNSDTNRLYRAFLGHEQMVTSLGVSQDGKLLVTSSTDGLICVFSLTDRKPTGHPDFIRQSDIVMEVDPGSAAQRAGVRQGDRLVTMDGKSVTELDNLLTLDRYPYKPGQQVEAVMERNGRRFTYQMTLVDSYDHAQPLLRLFITADGEWIVWTQQGYYDASPQADRLIGWHKNRGPTKSAEFHAVQQFRQQLYRPDIIDKVIELGNVEQAIAAANAARNRPGPDLDLRDPAQFEQVRPPLVEIISPADGLVSNEETVQVKVRVTSPNDLPVQDVTFLLDGNPAHVAHPNAGAKGQGVELTFDMTLSPGPMHTIGVIASNGQSTSSFKGIKVGYGGQRTSAAEKPTLWVLGVGIAKYKNSGTGFKDLYFSDKDATEFLKAVKQHENGKLYGRIETRLVTNADATKVNILDGIDWLVRSAKLGDNVAIFYSAHGFHEGQNFYLATHEVELDKLRATALSWNEITRTLHEDFAPVKRMVFLDTCHSGGVSAGLPITNPVHDLVQPEVGTIVFSSSTPREESLERSDWEHGAFTKALLETLRDKESDVSPKPLGDSLFDQFELHSSVADRVKVLTRDMQHPAFHHPPTLRKQPLMELIQ